MANEAGAQEDAGGGAPAGDSEDESKKFVPPKDGSWIPKARFDDAVNAEKGRAARLEAELAALRLEKAKPVDEAPRRYTKAELNAAVAAGQITADVADDVWAKQIREDAKSEAKREILDTVRAEKRQERIDSDLDEYKRLAPEIMDESSEVRGKLAVEYRELVASGLPDVTPEQRRAIERLALRNVLGPIDRLKTARSARREAEAHEETGGGGSGGGESRKAKTGWDALDKRVRDYYDGQIAKGLYPNRKAVEEELKFARPRSR